MKHKKSAKEGKRRKGRSDNNPDKQGTRLLKYCALGNTKKVFKILEKSDLLVNYRDSLGNTPLHQACRFAHHNLVDSLLKRGADANRQDAFGNTPAHVAALKGHTEVLITLLRWDPAPIVDLVNKDGISVRELTESLLTQSTHHGDTQTAEPGLQHPDYGREEDLAWRDRLMAEMSDGEAGLYDDGEDATFTMSTRGTGVQAAETEDEWADRIWQEMRRKKQREATTGFRFWKEAMQEQQARKQEAEMKAQQESKRILREEQAKEAAWRASLLSMSAEEQHSQYEAAWKLLESFAPDAHISYSDIPWILRDPSRQSIGPQLPGAGSSHGSERGRDTAGVENIASAERVQQVVLVGVTGPGDVKVRLRREIMRWHPDKFQARWGGRLKEGERERVMDGVKAMSQALTQIMTQHRS